MCRLTPPLTKAVVITQWLSFPLYLATIEWRFSSWVLLKTLKRNVVELTCLWQTQITSFGGLDLERKYPNQPSARHDHLPIAPSKAHPDNGILLVLKDPSCGLRKRSYVKTRDKHSILLASLQPYNRQGPEIFLSKRSYKTLIKRIQFSESADPIQSDYGNDTVKAFDWKKFRKYTKIVMSICLALLISYGFYRGGSWAVAACGRVLDWIKKAFQSIGGKAKSLWFSCWRRLGLEMMAY